MQVKVSKSGSALLLLLPAVTIPYKTTLLPRFGNSNSLALLPNNMSSCAYQDGSEVILHVVFSVAPVHDATQNLSASAEFSVDGGKTWLRGSEIFFEDHIDLKNGTDGEAYYQSWQYDQRWTGHADDVCYRVAVSDGKRLTSHADCMAVCKYVVPFHNAAGYCPN